jgi:diacylglycerol kinase family enzyme
MQITLIHNPGAGDGSHPDQQELQGMIKAAGHGVFYQSARNEDWKEALKRPADLVVVAGGDGTVGRVARRMIGRKIPFTTLPMGTANNISKSLGLLVKSTAEHIAAWRTGRRVMLDVGHTHGPWGERHFLEGIGLGLFAWMMPKADASEKMASIADPDEAISYALKMLQRLLKEHQPEHIKARLDGRDISGNYLLFEAMNMPYVGPNLHLAPNADAGDGLFDVVAVTEAHRAELLANLHEWHEGQPLPPLLPAFRGKHLNIEATANNVHIDDTIWQAGDSERPARADIEVRILPGALECLLPAK